MDFNECLREGFKRAINETPTTRVLIVPPSFLEQCILSSYFNNFDKTMLKALLDGKIESINLWGMKLSKKAESLDKP